MKFHSLLRSAFIALICLFQFPTSAQLVQIGTGIQVTGSSSASPINIYYRSSRLQIVYTRQELNAAGIYGGRISELGWYVDAPPSLALPNYSISLMHTSARDASSHISGTATTVYQNASYMPVAGGFDMLQLGSPWLWNGQDNIVVDVCWDMVSSYSSTGQVRYYNDSNYVAGYTWSDGSDQCGVNISSSTEKPQVQFSFQSISSDDAGTSGLNIGNIVCAGNQNITATVRNFGTNIISSLSVNWSVNGVAQTSQSISSPLDTVGGTGSAAQQVSMGSYNFVSGNTYNIKVWTSQPNGVADTSNFNDTLNLVATVGLDGNYTIGGIAPDYSNFTAAVNDLINNGVCGPVTFSVRDGSYNEQVEISTVPGASALNTITFEGESGDSSLVTMHHSSGSSNNYVVRLNAASNIHFRNLGFEATNSSYARVVEIIGDGQNVAFQNNLLKGVNTSNTSTIRNIVHYGGGSSHNHLYRNNRFENGSRSFYYDASDNGSHFSVVNNTFLNPYYRAFELEDVSHPRVDSNYIATNSSYSSFYGIHIYDCDSSVSVQNNHLHGATGGYGISVQYCDVYAPERGLISNNFVQIGEGIHDAEGIRLYNGQNFDVAYNSVNITSDNSNNEAFYHSSTNDVKILNNNFKTQTGYAFYIGTTSYITESDHNNLYSKTDIAYWDGDKADLAALQTASSMDSNSISEDPYFLNDTSYQAAQISLNNAGTPFTRVNTDIEGETRDASNPDIGADEFTPTGTDAGVIAIQTPDKPFAPGTYPVKALIKNYGGTALTSVALNWEQNEVSQSAVNWTGSLASGDTTWVTLGSVNFATGTLNDFKAFTSNPNSSADLVAINDSFEVKNIAAALGGTYTIGGSSPDFADFTTATQVLNIGGVYAAVVFDVRSGTYTEQISISNILRNDTTHSVTFQSETGDSTAVVLEHTASGSSDNYVVRLNGAKHIIFKDISLFANSTYSYGKVLEIDSNTRYLTVHNAVIKSNTYSSTTTNKALVYSSTSFQDEHLVFDNVHFQHGSYGIYLDGNYSYPEKGVEVKNCFFDQQYGYGLFTQYSEDLVFHDNIMEAGSDIYSSYYSAYFDDLQGGSIQRNQMYGGQYGINGLWINSGDGTSADPILVANNFVQIGNSNSDYGIRIDNCHYLDLVHNSVWVNGGDNNTAAYYHDYSNSSLNIYNNIFQNTGGGYAFYAQVTYGIDNSDHNNLYTSGTNIGYWSGDVTDLSAWITATSLDSNSLTTNVQFNATNDLHTNTANLNAAGIPISSVTHDIDMQPRDMATPDIGADEFDIPTDDAAITALQNPVVPFVAGARDVKLQLFNNGADTLNSVTIQWEVNGVAQTPFSWTGSIPSGQSLDSVNIGNYNFLFNSTYTIKAWTENPNSAVDAQPLNDTILVQGLNPALQGVYTIGGTTPDFPDFASAVQALELRGVGGWVTFSVRAGNYNEQLQLKEYLGASSQDTVVFQSESGDSSQVKLYYQPFSGNNYVLRLDGVDHIGFKDITIQNTGTSYGRVMFVDSGSTHNHFSNVAFLSDPSSTTTSSNMANVYVNSSFANDSNTFVNSKFNGGSSGILLYGSSGYAQGNRILECDFMDHYYRGILIDNQENLEFSQNTISSNSTYSYYYAIYLTDVTSTLVSRNELHSNRYAVFLNDFDGTSGNPSIFANNFVYLTGTDNAYGIYLDGSNYSRVVHNSVLVLNTEAGSSAFQDGNNSNAEVLNNIFQNLGGGYAVDYLYTYTGTWSDYNNLYTSGSLLGEWGSTTIADLATWKSASQLDTSSLSVDALFLSSTDLHTDNASLDRAATPLDYITDDFDGDPRDSQNPDIGADEFDIPTDDAALTSLQSPKVPFVAGNHDVVVELFNNGADTLNSVNIQWEINGVAQTPYNWSGALPSAQAVDSVNIGSFTFDFATQYTVKAWTEDPNNAIDAQPLNDTILVEGLYPALQGVYTIGGSTPDFPDFTSAVQALELRGVGGWVTFDVRAGNYNEQLVLKEFAGASSEDTVVFQSEAGDSSQVKLFYQASFDNNYVLRLDGVDHIGFKDLTIQNTGSSYGRVVEIDSGATHNYFSNVAFLSDPSATSTSVNMANVYANSSFANDSNTFNNSKFSGGSHGIMLYGPSGYAQGNRILNNDFSDHYYRGILIDNQENLEFSQNKIFSSSTYSSFYGFYLTDVTSALVSRNEIHSSRYGVYLNDFDGTTTEPSILANNFVFLNGNYNGYGIYLDGSNYSRVVHNSVLVLNTDVASSAFQDGSNSNTEVLNNIFQNEGGGFAVDYYYTYTGTWSNYNNLYTSGSLLGEWGSTTVADLAAWKSTTLMDTSSLGLQADFMANDDLHINLAALNAAATPLAYVTDDFDGDPRDSQNPDIGADEFTPNPNDVSLVSFEGPVSPFTAGNQMVYLTLLNNGADTLRSVIIEWTVNGVAQPSYNWSGTLLSGKTLDSIPLGNYNFATATYHDIEAWSSFPNSSSDADPSNDTLVVNDLYPALSGTYTIGGVTPDFNTFTEAADALSIGGITGWVTFNVRNGDYQEQLELGEIVGSSANDTILFQSEMRDPSLVSLSHSGANADEHTLKLNGTDFISFRDVTFKGESSTYAYTVLLDGATEKTNFINCSFWIAPGNSTSTSGLYVEDNGLNTDLRIINSAFTNGGYGLYADGNNALETGLELKGNTFGNQYYRGVYLRDYDAPVIQANDITSSSSTNSYRGLYLLDLEGSMILSKNKIYLPYNGQGINISNFSSTSAAFGLIANNFVSVGDSSNSGQNAVDIGSSNFLHIYHNSILNDSASGYALYLSNLSNSDIKNNNIIHQGTGHALYMVSNSSVSSDYNNLYSTGTSLVYDGANRADLAAWQGASSMDINSVSVDPLFISAQDLHVSLSEIDSAAFPLMSVTDDIDGEQRDPLYPDIGADEVLFFPDDMMVNKIVNLNSGCDPVDSSRVTVKITNKGSDPQSGFDLVMVLNNDTIRETVTASISGGSSINYTFAPYIDFTAVQPYDFSIWSEVAGDVNPGNDTLSKSIYHFPAPTISLTEDTVICAGTTANLQASGGTSYSWSDGSSGATIFVSPSDTTVYTVTVTDINGCTATDSVKISVATPPTTASIVAGGSTTVCSGDSLLLYSTITDDILWSTGESNDSIYVSQSGNYTLSYNKPGSVCGQVLLDNISVNVVKDSIKLNSFQTICIGDAVILTATNFTSGTWSTGETTQTITAYPTADSVFYATWTGSNGCQVTDSVSITVKPALPPAPVSNMTPIDGTLNLQTPVGFSWSPSANAVVYDLYVWKKGSSRPNFPTSGNISQIATSVSNLTAGEDYYWQIAAENSCFTTFSDTLEFSVIGLPDLTVDTLQIPPSALSGTNITITYTVKNIGEQSTGSKSWYDYIWLSSDEDLRRADDILLTKVSNLTYLDSGQSYTNTITVKLPQNVLSTQLLFVSTDNDDAYCATPGWVCYPGVPRKSHFSGMKELDEENNFAYDTLPITPSPAPDLIITGLGAPSSAFSGDEISLTTSLLNAGNAPAEISNVSYCYYISTDSLPSANAQQLFPASSKRKMVARSISSSGSSGGGSSKTVSVPILPPPPEYLQPDSIKMRTKKMALPQNIFGKYYLHAYIDCGDDVFEALGEGNNIFSSTPIDITLTPPPDLQVGAISGPDTASSGKKVLIDWNIVNMGATNPTYRWRDSIFLCSSPVFDYDSVVASGRRYFYNPNYNTSGSIGGTGGSFVVRVAMPYELEIPNGISGHYYVFIKADAEDDVFEYPFEQNNWGRKDTSIFINFSPYPDMQVTNMTVPATDTGYADTLYNLQWTVKNLGTGANQLGWRDEIYISTSPDPNASGKKYLGAYNHSSTLAVGDSAVRNINFKMPNESAGIYYFHVITDVDDDLYEYNFENNNTRSSTVLDPDGFYLKPRPVNNTPVIPVYNDLEALSVSAPANSSSGSQITVNWDVAHHGPDPIGQSESWNDHVYFSSDTILDNSDTDLGYKKKYGPLTVGTSYNASMGVQVPNGISGTYYLIVKLNEQSRLSSDTIPENDIAYTPINISLTPPPDLIVSSFSIPPTTVYGGQQVYVTYTVKNQGVGPINNKTWHEAFYLSSSPSPSGSNIGQKTITDSLAVGESYTDSVLISIPAYASGNYYLVMKTDNRNRIYEHSNEANNTSAQSWYIEPASLLQTDLVFESLAVPDTLMLGSKYTIPYQIRNTGSSTASGTLRNALYLGAGTTFNSATDKLFGFSDEYISMNSGTTFNGDITNLLEGVNAIGYYGIGRININAAIPETDYSNNDSTLPSTLYVDAEELTLGVPDSNTLDLEKPVYYKVNVNAGEDMLITLKSFEGSQGINEVYVAHGRVPSANDFDHQHQLQPGLDQEVLISNTQAGTYYILASTQSRFTKTVSSGGTGGTGGTVVISTQRVTKFQDVTLKAEILPYSILSISPDVVGKGIVTTTVKGAGFRDSLTISLEDNAGTTISTGSLKNFVNSTEFSVIWNLSSVNVGTYNVVVTNPDNSRATLDSGLTIEETTGFAPYMVVNAPKIIRTGKSAFFTFIIQNVGNVDIPYVKAEASLPHYAQVTSYLVNNPNVYLPSDMSNSVIQLPDWRENGNALSLPFTVRNLRPGQRVSIDATVKNFPFATFPYRLRATAANDTAFVQGTAKLIELVRQTLISMEDSIQSPAVLNLIYDQDAFLDSTLAYYVSKGLIDAADTVGVQTACSTCNDGYDFSPGTSPGRAVYSDLTLMPGQNMLWEINHPDGAPGEELGWDIIESVGPISITSTSSNPFQIDLRTLSSWDNNPDFLTTWSPGYDYCWPLMVADGGISGFSASKFSIDHSEFTDNTPIHGGQFQLQLSPGGDTLYLCFNAAVPQAGQNGIPGGDGQYGQDGGRGGPGGPCDPVNNIPPGKGGAGGAGGPGVGGYLAPGQGGPGGPGGACSGGSYTGGTGGVGGNGGLAGDGQNGGAGGDGGDGGFPGGDGGDGGDGGPSDDDTGPGPGGDGGDGDGPGDDGGDGDDGPGPNDPENPNNPNNPNYPPETPPIPPNGPPGGPKKPTGPGSPPPPPPSAPPAGCGGGDGGTGLSPCDYWGAANRAAGCGTTVFSCSELIAKGIAIGIVGGPGGSLLGGIGGVAGCGLGFYNCIDGGNAFTNCAELAINALSLSLTGSAVSGSGCAQSLVCDESEVRGSCDPNEIVGPVGYGTDRMVAHDQEMDYTIFFENDSALATTAAQRVEIRQEIHPNMDPLSLKLTEFGFADTSFQVPNVPNYTTTLDLTNDFGVDVEFTAGVDVINNELFWIFKSIDKNTGASPYDPLAGFLAVNDSTGRGEGYVKYTIEPASGVVTGDSITAMAEIVFDVNSSIITNTEFNIIDAVAPTSSLDMLTATQDSTSFSLSWNAIDDAGGSGVGNVMLFASHDGGPFNNVATTTGDSSTVFTGQNLSQYEFYTVAVDNVGNEEAPKQPETSTFINASNLTLLEPGDTSFCVGDTVEIHWRPGGVEYVSLFYSVAADSNYIPIVTAIDSLQTPFSWVIPDSLQSEQYLIRVSDTSSLFFSEGDTISISTYPVVSLTADASICAGDSIQLTASGGNEYRWNASVSISDTSVASPWVNPEMTTTYYVEVRNAAGCGVWDTVTVTVNNTDTTYHSQNTCDTMQAGVFTTVFNNQHSCDSVVIDTVIYRPSHLTTETAMEICQGDSLMLYGEYRSVAGVYYDTLQTQFGCDSVLAKELIVNPVYAESLPSISICDGDSALIFGKYQTETGVYHDSLNTVSGCDSILSVNLQVDPVFSTSQSLSICQGDSLLLEGVYQKTSGTYTDVFSAVNGCDSTVTTTLSVLPNAGSTETTNICAGDSIMLGGSWQTTAGSYVDIYPASNGCDSVVTTNLSILPQATASVNASICQGDSIMLGGSWQTTAGNYVDVYTAANGCDSTVTTVLTVHPSYNQQATANICQGDSMMLGGGWQITSGTYSDVYQTAQGCDSVINTTLSVISNAVSSENMAICAGDSILIAGAYRSMAGAYTDTFSAGPGCDSIHTVNLSLLPTASATVNASICQGDSLMLEGNWQTTAGTYHDTLVAANACDSVLTTNLSITPVVNVSLSASICQGDSIQLGGNWQTTVGVYTDIYTGPDGCDSIVSTTLTVLPTASSAQNASICQGDSIMLGGSWQTAAGNYVDFYTAGNGCDSTVTTVLTVHPSYSQQATASICQGDSMMLGGSWQSTSGTYTDVHQTTEGCDSVINTTLSVISNAVSSENMSICTGDSILIAGAYRKMTGAYTDTFSAGPGCDSIHTVNLSLLPTASGTVNTSICQGDSILLESNWQTTAGSYVDTLIAINGCDSVLTTNLSIIPVVNVSLSADICQGDSIQLGGSWQTTAGVYTDTYTGPNGCDSIVATTLSVLPNATGSVIANICQGDSMMLGGSWRTTAGNYVDVYTAANGCDSTVTTTLNITPNVTTSVAASICDGDSVMLGGNWQTTAGSYVDTYPAANGCDSIVTTNLSIMPVPITTAGADICPGDSVLIAGNWRSTAGAYVDTLIAVNGCDSLHTVNLSLYPDFNGTASATICQGDSMLLGGSWRTTAGTYVDSFATINGCDSIISTTLVVQSLTTGSASASICQGDSILLGGAYQTSAGAYVDTISSAAGCDSVVTTTLSINTVDTAVSVSNAVLTANASGATYRWIDCNSGQYISGETGRSFTPTANGLYAVEVTQNGCTDTSSCKVINDISLLESILDQMKYHPNPTRGEVNIDLGAVYGDVSVTIIDGSGKRLEQVSISGEREFSIDLSAYADGSYFLHIKIDEASKVIKVVKE